MDTNKIDEQFGKAADLEAPITGENNSTAIAVSAVPSELLVMDEKGKPYIKIDLSQISAAGAEALPIDRLKLPTLKLLNSTSAEVTSGNVFGARAGLWYNDITTELHEDLDFIPLHAKVNRYLYRPGSLQDMLCISVDGMGEYGKPKLDNDELAKIKGLSPIPHVTVSDPVTNKAAIVGDCSSCPNSKFADDGSKPPCQKVTWFYGCYAGLLREDNLDNLEQMLTNPSDMGEILGMCFGIPLRGGGGEQVVAKIRNTAIFTGGVHTQIWKLFASQQQQKNGPNRWWQAEASVMSKLSDRQKLLTNTLRKIVSQINPIITVNEESTVAAPPKMEEGATVVDV